MHDDNKSHNSLQHDGFEDSGLYEYKVFGTLSGVGPETCAKVYVDLEYRKTWDSYVNSKYDSPSLSP